MKKEGKLTCEICGKKSFKKFYRKNEYDLLRCSNCELVFVHPQPTDKELEKAYSYASGYFEHNDFDENDLNPKFKEIFDVEKKGNFLDIGCGNGSVVFAAKKYGWNAEGIDLNEGAVKRAKSKGLKITHTNIDNFKGRKNYYDLIFMGDLIEHVKTPKKTMQKAKNLLKVGGKIVLSTPNLNSFFPKYSYVVSKITGIIWSHPSPPYHLFEFSDKEFVKFLKKEGFEIEKISYSNISLAYSLGNTGLFKRFKSLYRKNKSISKSLLKNNIFNSLLMAITFVLYLPGYLISKKLKIKDRMDLVLVKK